MFSLSPSFHSLDFEIDCLDFDDPITCLLFDEIEMDEEDFNGSSGKRKLNLDEEIEIESKSGSSTGMTVAQSEQLTEYQQPGQLNRLSQGFMRTKRTYTRKPRSGFLANHYTDEIIPEFNSDVLLVQAAQELGEIISLQKSDDSMRFIYGIHYGDKCLQMILTVIKGSIFTVVWSPIARYDDQYLLELKGLDDSESTLLWAIKGFLYQSHDIESSDIDWNKMKQLQDFLQLNSIGVYSFARLLSRIILGLPLLEREGQHYDPNPATFMMETMFSITYPVELVGFDHVQVLQDPSLLSIIYDFVDVDGRGRPLELQSQNISPDHSVDVIDISLLRVVEIRKRNSSPNESLSLVIVLGTCSPSIPHRRYVCLDVQTLRQFVFPMKSSSQSRSDSIITLYNEEEWKFYLSSHLAPVVSSERERLSDMDMELEGYSLKSIEAESSLSLVGTSLESVTVTVESNDLEEISFDASSYWGSISYHSCRPNPTHSLLSCTPLIQPSSSSSRFNPTLSGTTIPPRYSDQITSKWLVGDVVYVPLSVWFEPEKLFAIPASSRTYLQAHVLKRTAKQVTLFLPALGKDFVRGFAFMEKTTSQFGIDSIILTQPEDVEVLFKRLKSR